MDHFEYRDGVLHAEDIPLPRIAEEIGTPFMSIRARRSNAMPRCSPMR
jgi:diaminopimelate decarboxylase